VKKAWNWISGHKVVQDMKKEVVKHAKATGSELANQYKDQAVSYAKGQMDRGKVWVKRQADAAITKVKKKADKHISDAQNKVEGVANKIDKFVSAYTGATDDQMPGRTVGTKSGSGFNRMRFRRRLRAGIGAWRNQR
jgi:hypothetical protein